jgi:hypothetical protein
MSKMNSNKTEHMHPRAKTPLPENIVDKEKVAHE